MPTLPAVIVTLLLPFEHLFDPRMSRASAKRTTGGCRQNVPLGASAKRTTGAVDDRPAGYNIAPVVQQQKADGSTKPPICRRAIANARAQAILTPGMTFGVTKVPKTPRELVFVPFMANSQRYLISVFPVFRITGRFLREKLAS